MPEIHAKFSPSAANRWLACTAAPIREAGYSRTSSDAADTGTCYHAVAELMLHSLLAIKSAVHKTSEAKLKRVFKEAFMDVQKYGTGDISGPEATALMNWTEAENNSLSYVRWIINTFGSVISSGHGSFGIEQRSVILDDEVFGTVDFVIRTLDEFWIIDLKTGRFPVSPEFNKQLMTYAAGYHDKASKFHLVIFQDMKPHVWSTTSREIKNHLDRIFNAVTKAKSNPEAVPGKHCKWCKAKADCPDFGKMSLDVAKSEFADIVPDDPTAEMTIASMTSEDALTLLSGFAAIEEAVSLALPLLAQRVFNGELSIPGFKLIRSSKHKRWADKKDAEKILKREIGDKAFKRSLITPNQAESLVKDKSILDGHWERPTGELKLVTIETRGKEIVSSARLDFGDDLL